MAKITSTVSTHSHAAQSVMARILATENINVVVDNTAHTAAFDLKNRTLILPQWKDMGKSVYDMLIGHEISHALHTPAEGWRATCDKISGTTDTSAKEWQTASLYLNVVEDARIERMIQVKFPGFRRDFIAAYGDLNAKNFFGVKGMDLNTLELPDRINLYYKLGTIGAVGIRFTASEEQFIRRIDAAQTFEDVATITEDLYNFCRQQKAQKQQNPPQPPQGPAGNGKSDMGASGQSDQGDGESGESQQGESDGDSEQDSSGSSGGSTAGDDGEQKEQPKAATGNNPGSSPSTGSAPTPMTQQKFNENLSNNTHRANNEWEASVTAPTVLTYPDLSRVLVDCKEILAQARIDAPFVFSPQQLHETEYMKRVTAINEKFFRDSKRQIDLLVKQFELRKAAAIAKRESVRKTGVLDTVRMVNYKFSEDIFRRNTMLPEGKNHGLVMFVDWSGSMQMCIDAVMEQTFVLCEFCRRIGIPFEVFAFTTTNFHHGRSGDKWGSTDDDKAQDNVWQGEINVNHDSKTANTAPHVHHTFSLLNLLSSRLNKNEYRDMVSFLRALTARGRQDMQQHRYIALPSRWELSGTALDESIVAAIKIVPQFREQNRLDIVNTIFLTDGDTSCPYTTTNRVIDPETKAVYSAEEIMQNLPVYPAHGSRWNPYESNLSTDILLTAFRKITGSRAVGMFLTSQPTGMTRHFREQFTREFNREMANRKVGDKYAEQAAWRNAEATLKKLLGVKFKEDNCLVADEGTTGYDEYFIIKSNTRVIADSDPLKDLTAGDSLLRVKRAFAASFNNSNKSRVLVNRFIELIAR